MTIQRLLFVTLSTVVAVFFSEKAYWYPQGYAILELILFYAFPVYATLWALDYFRVRRLPGVVLIGALYAFLVEGVLTPVLFEGGLFSPIMPAYFVGWHGLLSIVFGWFLLRRWLVRGQWARVALSATLVGVFWGAWSITYWLPENFEEFARPGQWPTADFALHALLFTGLLMLAHGVLGRVAWPAQVRPTRLEALIVGGGLLFFYATLSFPGAPLGAVTLIPLLGFTLLPLALKRRRRKDAPTLYDDLAGRVRPAHLLGLLLMPLAATGVYGLAVFLAPAPDQLRAIQELFTLFQLTAGGGVFVGAWIAVIRD
jgi:hypothetical protein